jgi:hypothetical protein
LFWFVEMMPTTPFQRRRRRFFGEIFGNGCFLGFVKLKFTFSSVFFF